MKTEDLRNLNEIIARLKRGKLIVVTGNHDPQSAHSAYTKIKWSDKIYIAPIGLDRLELPELHTDIYTFSWDKKLEKEDVLATFKLQKYAQTNILLIHGDMVSPSVYLPLNFKAIAGMGFDYVALGHIHKPTKITDQIVYSGSFEPLDTKETGQHGFMLCEIKDQMKRYQFIPFAKRAYIELEIFITPTDSEIKIIDIITEKLSMLSADNIYIIKIKGNHTVGTALSTSKIDEEVQNRGWYCTCEDLTRPDYDLKLLMDENKENIIGAFIRSFGEIEQLNTVEYKALIYGVEALLLEKGVSL